MKNFALVMGLLFGSAGAHTYPKSRQVAPPPALLDENETLSLYRVYCIEFKCLKCQNLTL